MIPFDQLVELFRIATEAWGGAGSGRPPTPESLLRIYGALGVRVPDDLVRLATLCPAYVVKLAGIGDDYDNPNHIISLNRAFHDQTVCDPPLPPYLVLVDHGHDGDCDCWDAREVTACGEHPVIYFALEGERPSRAGRFESFRDYVQNYAVMNAPRNPTAWLRRRAKCIIREFEDM